MLEYWYPMFGSYFEFESYVWQIIKYKWTEMWIEVYIANRILFTASSKFPSKAHQYTVTFLHFLSNTSHGPYSFIFSPQKIMTFPF